MRINCFILNPATVANFVKQFFTTNDCKDAGGNAGAIAESAKDTKKKYKTSCPSW